MHSVFLSEISPILLSEEVLNGKEFEILKTGQFYDSRYGKFEITEKLMDELVTNFESNLLEIDIALDINHDPEKGAFAWLKSLQRRDNRLYAVFKDFTLEGRKFLREKVYKYLSVEFAPFTKIEEDKEVTYKNVLRGIALTNRPVIKGMQPCFLSETIKVSNQKDMSIVKIFADELLKRNRVTQDDVAMLKTAFSSLSEEEQSEAQESVEEVEAKAEESAAAEAKAAEEAAKAEAEAAAKAAEEAKATGDVAALQAAETRAQEFETKLAEATKLVVKYEEEKRARVLHERVESLILSEKNPKGFSAAQKEGVSTFVSSLSDEQFTQFSELMPKFVTVNLAEFGSGASGNIPEGAEAKFGDSKLPVKDAEVDAQIRALAEKEKFSYFEASIKFAENLKK